MTLPNLSGVRDPAVRENLDYLDERSLYPQLGDLQLVGSNTSRPNWRVADGAAVSRTGFSELFRTIGTQEGSGDGSTTFNLPNAAGTEPTANTTWIVRVR